MRFLCLCGAYGSADKFQGQLAPLVNELSSDNTAELHFVHGPVEAFPPEEFEEFYGLGPYFRFIEPPKIEEGGGSDVLERIRNFSEGAAAEDQMHGNYGGNQSAQDAIDHLYGIIEKDGPFDGIIGYSEGATIAASLLLHEQRRFETQGIPPMFECALLFAGWPPMNPDLDAIVLADESDLTINIPTCLVTKYSRFQ